jgi:mRNA-degrading endonuclease RelE of RelBE toxin-antitoxin system
LAPTRHHKPLRTNELSKWELRLGKYRVFYDVEEEARIIRIKAVGWKEHNRLFIRGKEYLLENR